MSAGRKKERKLSLTLTVFYDEKGERHRLRVVGSPIGARRWRGATDRILSLFPETYPKRVPR